MHKLNPLPALEISGLQKNGLDQLSSSNGGQRAEQGTSEYWVGKHFGRQQRSYLRIRFKR